MPGHRRTRMLFQPALYSLLQAVFWSIVITISLTVALMSQRREMISIAENVARANIEKDLLIREWAARRGGIYVEIDEETPPNPYIPLDAVPEREVTTPTGRRLTYVNPSYLTRQLYDLARKENNISGRITSLQPLNPDNWPDEWEKKALKMFEQGAREHVSFENVDGRAKLRLMRPLFTEENCMSCHSRQGYVVGDVRGGISVLLSMGQFESSLHKQAVLVWIGHILIWFFGLTFIYTGYCGMKRRTEERDRAEKELQRANAILEGQATTDFLTGISNRRRFVEILETVIARAERYGTSLTVIFFDIDYFKKINDTFGHQVGDRILAELAALVSSTIRSTDLFARLGGEEFVILLQDNGLKTGNDLAEKIRATIEKHSFPVVGEVTCSFGVAQYCHGDTVQHLVNRADEAMYTAKQNGRNRVEAQGNDMAGYVEATVAGVAEGRLGRSGPVVRQTL